MKSAAKALWRKHSFDELGAALLALGLWPANRGAQMRVLEATALVLENRHLCRPSVRPGRVPAQTIAAAALKLAEIVPENQLDDYVPVADWGSLRVRLGPRDYRIFSGVSLSNPYDHLALFKALYLPIAGELEQWSGYSPLAELEFVLELQELLLRELPWRADLLSKPGQLVVPPVRECRRLGKAIVNPALQALVSGPAANAFVAEVDAFPATSLLNESFWERAMTGKLLRAVATPGGQSLIPIAPQRATEILIDRWWDILSSAVEASEARRSLADRAWRQAFGSYLHQRYEEFFAHPTAHGDRSAPVDFALAHGDSLLLVWLAPLDQSVERSFERGAESLAAAREETRLISAEGRVFLSGYGWRTLSTQAEVRLIGIASPSSTASFAAKLPGPEVPFLSAVDALAIFDGASNVAEILRFLRFRSDLPRLSAPISALDLFSAFKWSNEVLIPGAQAFDMVGLDPHGGTQWRHSALSRFFEVAPPGLPGSDPRVWDIQETPVPTQGAAVDRSTRRAVLWLGYSHGHVFLAPLHHPDRDSRVALFLVAEVLQYWLPRFFEALPDALAGLHGDHVVFIEALPLDGSEREYGIERMPSQSGVAMFHVAVPVSRVLEDFANPSTASREVAIASALLHHLEPRCDLTSSRASGFLQSWSNQGPGFKIHTFDFALFTPGPRSAVVVEPRHLRSAQRDEALLVRGLGLRPGRYRDREAKELVDRVRLAATAALGETIRALDQTMLLRLAIEQIELLWHSRLEHQALARGTAELALAYDREQNLATAENDSLGAMREARYLIEKTIWEGTPGGSTPNYEHLRALLAQSRLVLDLYALSDDLHYDKRTIGLEIKDDLRLVPELSTATEARADRIGLHRARRMLTQAEKPVENSLFEDHNNRWRLGCSVALEKDLGFDLETHARVLAALARGIEAEDPAPWYAMTRSEAIQRLALTLNLSPAIIDRVLCSISIDRESVGAVRGCTGPPHDVPWWEIRKRQARYSVQPVVHLRDAIQWGPHSCAQAGQLWHFYLSRGQTPFPSDDCPHLELALSERRREIEARIVDLSYRHVLSVPQARAIKEARLHRLNKEAGHPEELGDYDVLAYLPSIELILAIECKSLRVTSCQKDHSSQTKEIFESYLPKVQRRHTYLEEHGGPICRALGWTRLDNGARRVLSLFVTPQIDTWSDPDRPSGGVTFVSVDELPVVLEDLLARP